MPRRIPEETKQRAIRLVLNHLDEYDNLTEACKSVGAQLGIGKESLRRWVRQAQIDVGQREGTPSDVLEENKQLRKKVRELEEANSILRDAAVFFAGELGPRTR
ncbi:transposase [Flaviflexus massiliensis]|uniref:transposase n=1 Tax=Flaviflexus massiliensis TaxID=1522309 RepID=UPI0006D571A6|nr:transposase [Flaviflexus massiliensis]